MTIVERFHVIDCILIFNSTATISVYKTSSVRLYSHLFCLWFRVLFMLFIFIGAILVSNTISCPCRLRVTRLMPPVEHEVLTLRNTRMHTHFVGLVSLSYLWDVLWAIICLFACSLFVFRVEYVVFDLLILIALLYHRVIIDAVWRNIVCFMNIKSTSQNFSSNKNQTSSLEVFGHSFI